MQLNIPNNAVKAKILIHVGGQTTKVTGWEITDSDIDGVFDPVAEITPDDILHGKFIGADPHDVDQGLVTFVAEVALH